MKEPNIGKAIKDGLKKKGWKQKELASYLGKTNSTISEWTTNKTAPSSKDLIKIAQILDVVDVLFPEIYKEKKQDTPQNPPKYKSLKISQAIKKGRIRKNLTQKKLADVINVNVGLISKWECGEKIPRGDTLIKIIDYLQIEDLLFPRISRQVTEVKNAIDTMESMVSGLKAISLKQK